MVADAESGLRSLRNAPVAVILQTPIRRRNTAILVFAPGLGPKAKFGGF